VQLAKTINGRSLIIEIVLLPIRKTRTHVKDSATSWMPTHKSWVVPPKVQGSSDYSNVRATRPFKVLFVIRDWRLPC
jgi:hypothetical protein